MTPEEAIKYLREQLAVRLGSGNLSAAMQQGDKIAHSIQLGVEALERHRSNYLKPQCADFRRLPSEAEE